MNELEKLLSEVLTKDPKHPVTLHIDREETESLSAEGPIMAAEEESTVTIPLSVYTELLASAVRYEILARSYHSSKYGVDSGVEKAVFGASHAEEAEKSDA